MSTLIVHIGSQKTGTTAIQSFMADNRGKLAEAGFALPSFTDQRNRGTLHSGAFFEYCVKQAAFDSVQGSFPSPEKQEALARSAGKLVWQPALTLSDRQENVERMRQAASRHPYVLISDEALYDDMLHEDGLDAGARLFWGTVPSVLEELGFERIRVIVYLRRQDEFFGSYWKQFVKTFDEDLPLGESLRTSSGYWRSNLDYERKVRIIEEGLGERGEVVVRRYDRSSFEGGDLLHDFCHAAGISWDDGFSVPGVVNESLSYDVCEALRSFAPLFVRDPLTGSYGDELPLVLALRKEALLLSEQYPDEKGILPFAGEAREEFMRPFLEGNAALGRRYFGGEDLFPEPSDARAWEPDRKAVESCNGRLKRALMLARLRRSMRRLLTR